MPMHSFHVKVGKGTRFARPNNVYYAKLGYYNNNTLDYTYVCRPVPNIPE